MTTTGVDPQMFYNDRGFQRFEFINALIDHLPLLADPTIKGQVYPWDGVTYRRPWPHSRNMWERGTELLDGLVSNTDPIPDLGRVAEDLRIELVARGRVCQQTEFSGVMGGRPVAVFRNGTVDLTTGELTAPSPDTNIVGAWDTDYDAEMPVPRYDRWLTERGLNSQRALLESVLGTMFDTTYRYPRILVFSGTWSAGKSALMGLIRDIGGSACVTDSDLFPIAVYKHRRGLASSARVMCTDSVPVCKKLSGARGGRYLSKRLNEFPSSALQIVETLGDGWGMSAGEHRRWEASAPRDLIDLVTFNHRVSDADRHKWTTDELPQLRAELPGIAARWIRARIHRIPMTYAEHVSEGKCP